MSATGVPLSPEVRFDDLLAGFDLVSVEPTENEAYVSRRTGLVHWASEFMDLDDELPQDIDDASVYVAVPSKADLGLGRALALQFTRDFMPNAYGQASAYFHHRGAYAKFKALLDRHDLLDAWHAHEAEAVERALRAWAAEQGIRLGPD